VARPRPVTHLDHDLARRELATGLPSELRRLVEGLERADAFALDARLWRALGREQSLEARIAPLLVLAWRLGVHRALGFTTRKTWVCDYALTLAETQAFRRSGGLSVEARRRAAGDEAPDAARSDREIRANHRDAQGEAREGGREEEALEGVEGERETRAHHRDAQGESRWGGGGSSGGA